MEVRAPAQREQSGASSSGWELEPANYPRVHFGQGNGKGPAHQRGVPPLDSADSSPDTLPGRATDPPKKNPDFTEWTESEDEPMLSEPVDRPTNHERVPGSSPFDGAGRIASMSLDGMNLHQCRNCDYVHQLISNFAYVYETEGNPFAETIDRAMNLTLSTASGREAASYVETKAVRFVCVFCCEQMHNAYYRHPDQAVLLLHE